MKFWSLLLTLSCLACLAVGCKAPQDPSPDNSNPPASNSTPAPISLIGKETLQYPGKNDEYEYNVYETYVELREYLGEAPDVTVPETLENLPVKVVGGFLFNTTIKHITLPEGIVVIKNSAFDNCENLETINIPESVIEIGSRAFYDCFSLQSLTIPKSVTTIGNQAFGYGSEVQKTLVVRFYKGSAAAEYVAKHSDLQYEILDK